MILINYVGGLPSDLRNLYITHTIFFTPYFLELHSLLSIKFDRIVYYIIRGVYVISVIVIMGNIGGIFGLLQLDPKTQKMHLNDEYLLPISFELMYDKYILVATLVYISVFIATMVFSHMIQLQVSADTDENVTSTSSLPSRM